MVPRGARREVAHDLVAVGAFAVAFQHQSSRVSVLGLFHGSLASGLWSGLPGKIRQRAVNGGGGVVVSSVTVPVYVRGSTGGTPSRNSQTCTK